jgi:sortase A
LSPGEEKPPPRERDPRSNPPRQARRQVDSEELDALLRRTRESVLTDFEEIRRSLEEEKARIVDLLLETFDTEEEAVADRRDWQSEIPSEGVAEPPERAAPFPDGRRTRRHRSLRQRVYGIAATSLATVGLVLLAETGITLLWQEPLSHAYTSWQQGKLNDQLDEVEASFQAPSPRARGPREPAQPSLADHAEALAQKTDAEGPLGRLRIPDLDVEQVFVEGVGSGSLARAPGHYEDTPLPGQRGTVGIAGHRTTYSAPFRDIDQLADGQAILVEMPYGRFAYRVTGSTVVPPDQISVLARVDHDRLALTSCDPPFSDSQRIVVFARLRRSTPNAERDLSP